MADSIAVGNIIDNSNGGKVENLGEMGDNTPNESGNTAAGVSAPEDTAEGWEQIVSTKDEIIGAYEKQVASLKKQVETLMRNGAVINDGKGEEEKPESNSRGNVGNALGGFGQGFSGGGDYVSVKDLGKEIGKRER